MARTTEAAVRALFPAVEAPSSISLASSVDTATDLVTELCVPEGYTATRLELIERWLAAHFAAIGPLRQYASRAIGEANASFDRVIGLALDQTPYGQMAKVLDTKGGLSAAGGADAEGTAGVLWLGETPEKTLAERDAERDE